MGRQPTLNSIQTYLLVMFVLTCAAPLSMVAQDIQLSSQDSTELCVQQVLLEVADSSLVFDSIANYQLMCRTQNSYSEVIFLSRDSLSGHEIISSSRELYPSIQIDQMELAQITDLTTTYFMSPSSRIQSRGNGQYLVIQNRAILQHGGQTSMGMEVMHYLKKIE